MLADRPSQPLSPAAAPAKLDEARPESNRILIVIVAVAFLLRVALMIAFRTWEFADARDHYAFGFETGSVAASLARGYGFSSPFGGGVYTGPTAWLAPIYPAMVAMAFKVFGVFSPAAAVAVLTLNSALSALTCLTIFSIGRRIFGRAAGLWSAWLWALVPFYSRWPITWVWETAAAALILSWLFLLTLQAESPRWKPWLKLGAVWGLAALTCPSVLGFLPFSLLYPAWKLRPDGKRTAARFLAASILFAALIAPWIVRNQVVFHKPVFLRGNYWFEFSLSNYHGSNGAAWSGAHPALNPAYLKHYTEIGEMAFVAEKKAKAFEFVRACPGEFASLVGKRVIGFWDGNELEYERRDDPFKPWMVLVTSLLAGAGLWLGLRRRVPGMIPFLGLFALYPIPYYLTYVNPRYRHPIEPMMAVLTGYLLVEGWKKIRVLAGRP